MENVLKAFLIGSSFPAFVLFFIGFHAYSGKFRKKNCIAQWFNIEPYFFYTLIAPVYMGLMSVLAILISCYFQISIRTAFFIVSIISTVIVSTAITVCKVYRFSKERLREQYLRLLGYHLLLYNIIISNLYLKITPRSH